MIALQVNPSPSLLGLSKQTFLRSMGLLASLLGPLLAGPSAWLLPPSAPGSALSREETDAVGSGPGNRLICNGVISWIKQPFTKCIPERGGLQEFRVSHDSDTYQQSSTANIANLSACFSIMEKIFYVLLETIFWVKLVAEFH